MSLQTNKTFIFKKTAQIGFLVIVSRLLGLVREIMQGYYLGINTQSDAFITAFRLPNLLRKLFEANGLTAAIVPHTVKMIHEKRRHEVSQFITTILLALELLMLVFCALVWFFPERAILLAAPGFVADQVAATVPVAKIMFPMILGFAGFSVLSTALHAVNHFLIPALGPTVFNAVYLIGLGVCWNFDLPVNTMAFFVTAAAMAKFLLLVVAFRVRGFSFSLPSLDVFDDLKITFKRILPCLITFGAMEINSFMDIRLSSYLQRGTVTMMYLMHRFYMLPYSIFAVSLGTVLLSQFSDSVLKNPKRISFYLLECFKLATWFAIPVTVLMIGLSNDFFSPVMFKGRATPELIALSGKILSIMVCAFPFQILNKIMFKALLSRNDTTSSMKITLMSLSVTTAFNYLLVESLGAYAMAWGTVLCSVLKTVALLLVLWRKHQICLPYAHYFKFLQAYAFQFFFGVCFFGFQYATLSQIVSKLSMAVYIESGHLGYWFFVLAVFASTLFFLWRTYNYFGIRLYLMPYHTKH